VLKASIARLTIFIFSSTDISMLIYSDLKELKGGQFSSSMGRLNVKAM
jgi:hypothetical protein